MIITNSITKLKKITSNTALFLFSAILLSILVSFFSTHPKVSATVLPEKRERILNEFLTTVKTEESIDPQTYWEFREFYSPGYLDYSRDGLGGEQAEAAKEEIGIPLQGSFIDRVFLIYHSPHLTSIDLPTTATSLEQVVPMSFFYRDELLLKNKNTIVSQRNDGSLLIIFLLTEGEMKRANGHVAYLDNDQSLIKNKQWLNITKIHKK